MTGPAGPTRVALAGGLGFAVVLLGTGSAVGSTVQAPEESYVVVLDAPQGTPETAGAIEATAEDVSAIGGDVTQSWDTAVTGLAMTASPAQAADVAELDGVAGVYPDVEFRAASTQAGAPWQLDRIDQRALPLTTTYVYAGGGAGATAYVIDSGIRASHAEFRGRVATGVDFVGDGRGTADCAGHGTEVAGVLGGTSTGAAKNVTLVPVRILACDGTGTASALLSALDWVAANHQGASVVVLSIEGPAYSPVDLAIRRLVTAGVAVTAAAGNSASDSCLSSPAREPSALTVGATGLSDARSSFSSFGTCVDLFAPGESVITASSGGDNSYVSVAGTSFSAPLAAGVVALAREDQPNLSASAAQAAVVSAATTGVVTNAGTGSPNRLLYSAPTATPISPLVVVGDPTVDGLMSAVAAELGGVIEYVATPSAYADRRTQADFRGGEYPGCVGLTRPRFMSEGIAALESSLTELPSTVTGESYGTIEEQCVDAAAGTG